MSDPTAGSVRVRLPDGSTKELPEGTSALEFAESIGQRLAKAAVAASFDGREVDLTATLPDGAEVSIITEDKPEGVEIMRHSASHVLAQAVTKLWPGARYAIGPVIEDGFYYDFELPDGQHFAQQDLERIEGSMRAIIEEDQPFVRQELSIDEGLQLFAQQPYKQEIIEAVSKGANEVDASAGSAGADTISVYRNGDEFVDLCRGPHVPSTGRVRNFKLMRVAGAYWRGDEKRTQLQRIYGTAWPSAKGLAEYLHRLEEAERRDHRKLGADLDLFSFPEEVGSGLAIFHPKGGLIRRLMEDYSRERHVSGGYEFVNSPHISKAELFETSGHLQWFADGMFPPMELDGGQQYYLKPMNCPFHILVFRSRQRSYRELPLRFFEFGTVYRYEKSGVVHGLTRVRGLTMDDSHIFCTREQMPGELTSLLRFILEILGAFGLDDTYLELSTRPEDKAVGRDEEWEEATEALSSAARSLDLELVRDEGGGAFYGPKISVQARDAIGRSHQMSTMQLDFQEPQRFGLEYIASDNSRQQPVMIHRALFGSIERFMAILLEHYAGALPTWLMPEQVVVIPVSTDQQDYAVHVAETANEAGLRSLVLTADDSVGARVRRAKMLKAPYVLVVGADDAGVETVGVNARGSNKPDRGVALGALIERVVAEVKSKGSPDGPTAETSRREQGNDPPT